MFTRKTFALSASSHKSINRQVVKVVEPVSEQEFRVLVINSSQEMAKEIGLQLTISIPGCSIMFAPSLELARLILARRQIELVVSSAVLPDGGLLRLKSILARQAERHPTPTPSVVIVGEAPPDLLEAFKAGTYEVSHVRKLQSAPELPANAIASLRGKALRKTHVVYEQPRINRYSAPKEEISSLGADLRNDLNNPLQEIVAMVFVAKARGASSAETTTQALDAIDRAAKNMATVVRGIEDKIRNVVLSPTATGSTLAAPEF